MSGEAARTRYLPIAEHGLIGDLHTAALVGTDGTDGTIDWYCCPRFDSPSVFAALLDADRGGRFRIAPEGDRWTSKQLYLPDTAVLITRFLTPGGVGEVQDFMSPATGVAYRHRLIRRVVRGRMRFVADVAPRFGYARGRHEVARTAHGALFRSADLALVLSTCCPLQMVADADVQPHDVPCLLFGVAAPQTANALRFRIRPNTATTLILTGKLPGPGVVPQAEELTYAAEPGSAMRPYDRLIGAALAGNRLEFARQDVVDAAWRVVDPILGDAIPVHAYARGTWGPHEAVRLLPEGVTWHEPRG